MPVARPIRVRFLHPSARAISSSRIGLRFGAPSCGGNRGAQVEAVEEPPSRGHLTGDILPWSVWADSARLPILGRRGIADEIGAGVCGGVHAMFRPLRLPKIADRSAAYPSTKRWKHVADPPVPCHLRHTVAQPQGGQRRWAGLLVTIRLRVVGCSPSSSPIPGATRDGTPGRE